MSHVILHGGHRIQVNGTPQLIQWCVTRKHASRIYEHCVGVFVSQIAHQSGPSRNPAQLIFGTSTHLQKSLRIAGEEHYHLFCPALAYP
jgi:hypothetical protein